MVFEYTLLMRIWLAIIKWGLFYFNAFIKASYSKFLNDLNQCFLET